MALHKQFFGHRGPTRTEAIDIARAIVDEHPLGCSCGDPECPQYQADLAGEAYVPDDFVQQYVSDQVGE